MIDVKKFGFYKGKDVFCFTLKNDKIETEIISFGGAIRTLKIPDKFGNKIDVVLGYDDLDSYVKNGGALGALIGRFGNRIEKGKFTLNGKDYQLEINNGINSLHGGFNGFNRQVWDYELCGNNLVLRYFSADNEGGYPGNLSVEVIYSLSENGIKIEYSATCDADTIINLTNHTYFNLNGEGTGDVLDNLIYINSDSITPVDENLIPHGEFMDVTNTPFDLRKMQPIGKDIDKPHKVMQNCNGYDTNYVLCGDGYRLVAKAESEKTGIKMQCYTDQKGVQFYTGNFLDGAKGKTGNYQKRYGFCLETQNYPNAVNCPNYPSAVLKKGEKYHTVTEFKFM